MNGDFQLVVEETEQHAGGNKGRYKETRSLLYVWFNSYCYTRLLKWIVFFLYLLSFSFSVFRWCTAAASVDKQQRISTIEFCVWVPPRKIRTIPSTSWRMRGGDRALGRYGRERAVSFLMRRLTLMRAHLCSVQEHALSAGDLQHHADGPDGRCCQTGESLLEVCEVPVFALMLQVFLQNKALDFYHSLVVVLSFKYKLYGVNFAQVDVLW